MNRIIKYFSNYNIIDKTAQDFLYRHGRLHTYKKGSYYMSQQQKKQEWCFLLEGLVGYEVVGPNGQLLERLCPVHHYFVGTKHAYSTSPKNTALIFLQPSVIYTISNKNFRQGLQQHQELDKVYHILKQHELNLANIFLRLPKIAREQRLAFLYQALPEVEGAMTVQQICSLLGYTDHRQYYKALNYYFDKSI